MSIHKQLNLTIYEAVDLHFMLTEYVQLMEDRRTNLMKDAPTTDEWMNKLMRYNELVQKQTEQVKDLQTRIAKLYADEAK